MPLPLLPTSLVGSYAQPDWLIDRAKLAGRFPPRVRARELWRVAPELLEQAQDDATLVAIRDQERAGLDIITDGEIRRESYSNRFATALEGVDIDNPGSALDRSGHPNPVPRIVGPIRRKHAVEVEDLKFLKAHTNRKVKITVPGPFTMSCQAQNDHYQDVADAAMDYADAANAEMPPFPEVGNAPAVHTAFFFSAPGSVHRATHSGTWGDARESTPEFGERYLQAVTRGTLRVLDDIERTFEAMPPR